MLKKGARLQENSVPTENFFHRMIEVFGTLEYQWLFRFALSFRKIADEIFA
jgi:hypothetical protein